MSRRPYDYRILSLECSGRIIIDRDCNISVPFAELDRGLSIDVGGSISAMATTIDFRNTTIDFDGATLNNFTGNILGNSSTIIDIASVIAEEGIFEKANVDVLCANTIVSANSIVTGNVLSDVTGNVTGDVTGNVTGDVTGNVTGDVTGDVTGNVTGDVTGNVTGDVCGNITTLTLTPKQPQGNIIVDGSLKVVDVLCANTISGFPSPISVTDVLELDAGFEATYGNVSGNIDIGGYVNIDNIKVLGEQQPSIADVTISTDISDGTGYPTEANVLIELNNVASNVNAILSALRAHGLIAI